MSALLGFVVCWCVIVWLHHRKVCVCVCVCGWVWVCGCVCVLYLHTHTHTHSLTQEVKQSSIRDHLLGAMGIEGKVEILKRKRTNTLSCIGRNKLTFENFPTSFRNMNCARHRTNSSKSWTLTILALSMLPSLLHAL